MSEQTAIHTILYATDMGEHMRPVFRYAIDLAEHHDANIIMVHVAEPLTATGYAVVEAYLPEELVEQHHQEGMHTLLERMKGRIHDFCEEETGFCPGGSSLVSDVVVAHGRPSLIIPELALEHAADIIVMGTCSHRLLGHGLLGSTAQRVIQRSKIPVMTVPNCEG